MTPPGPAGPPAGIDLDPEAEVTPFALFRSLREGRAPLLVDLRPRGGGLTLRGAVPRPEGGAGEAWAPPAGREVVLFDDDGAAARALARRLRAEGHAGVRSLYGGLRLYDFALDPEVVGRERFLVRAG